MNPIIIITLFMFISSMLSAQDPYEEIKLEGREPFLVGHIELKTLSEAPYRQWYEANAAQYEVDTTVLLPYKKDLQDFKILLFMGTWCGDSKSEVPRFIKILEAIDFPMERLKIVAVDRRKDRYKKSLNGEEWGLNIKRVPTFIFYRRGREIHRIIENPVNSLEEDIKAIVTGKDYQPNYAQSLHFD